MWVNQEQTKIVPLCQTPFQFAIWDPTQWLNGRGRQQTPALITARAQSESGRVFWFTGVWKYLIFWSCCPKAACSSSRTATATSCEWISNDIELPANSARHFYMNAETVCLRAAVGYQACGPSCSCSSPPGIGSRSRFCRLWGCKCWRSPSPSM